MSVETFSLCCNILIFLVCTFSYVVFHWEKCSLFGYSVAIYLRNPVFPPRTPLHSWLTSLFKRITSTLTKLNCKEYLHFHFIDPLARSTVVLDIIANTTSPLHLSHSLAVTPLWPLDEIMAKNTTKLNDPCFDLDCINLPRMIKADPATAGRGVDLCL